MRTTGAATARVDLRPMDQMGPPADAAPAAPPATLRAVRQQETGDRADGGAGATSSIPVDNSKEARGGGRARDLRP